MAKSKVPQSHSLIKSHGQNGNGAGRIRLPNLVSTPQVIDFEVQNHGSIFLLCPLTDAAIEWVDKHLPEDVMTFGRGICVEHRFISDIVRGIQDSGLVAR